MAIIEVIIVVYGDGGEMDSFGRLYRLLCYARLRMWANSPLFSAHMVA